MVRFLTMLFTQRLSRIKYTQIQNRLIVSIIFNNQNMNYKIETKMHLLYVIKKVAARIFT